MAETTWTYTVQDFSPLLVYSSSTSTSDVVQPNLDSAWQQACPAQESEQLNPVTVCDISSSHTTNVSGASMFFGFYGKGVESFGNATSGMAYRVTVDSGDRQTVIEGGNGTTQPQGVGVLASIANLPQGDHFVTLTAEDSSNDATLLFERAVVTVGTGLTGATVNRTVIQDNDELMSYGFNSSWTAPTFDDWGIQRTASNTTWHQLMPGSSGSVSFTVTGNALLLHGLAWSFYPSDYRIAMDGMPPQTMYGNASLQNSSPGRISVNGLRYVNSSLSGNHTFVIDNANGTGALGVDYIEVISLWGGRSLDSSHIGKTTTIIIGAILGSTVLLTCIVIYIYRRRRRTYTSLNHTEDKFSYEIQPFEVAYDPYAGSTNSADPISTSAATVTYDTVPAFPNKSKRQPRTPVVLSWQGASPAVESGSSSHTSEPPSSGDIMAIRRDLDQLMQVVGNSRAAGHDVGEELPPPRYE